MAKVPTVEELKNCNCAMVYFKSAIERPVTISGTFEQVSNDDDDLIIKTNSQYAVFKSSEICGVHFYRSAFS